MPKVNAVSSKAVEHVQLPQLDVFRGDVYASTSRAAASSQIRPSASSAAPQPAGENAISVCDALPSTCNKTWLVACEPPVHQGHVLQCGNARARFCENVCKNSCKNLNDCGTQDSESEPLHNTRQNSVRRCRTVLVPCTRPLSDYGEQFTRYVVLARQSSKPCLESLSLAVTSALVKAHVSLPYIRSKRRRIVSIAPSCLPMERAQTCKCVRALERRYVK